MAYIKISRRTTDLTGKRFARLTVLGPVGKVRRTVMWLCRCDCGGTATTTISSLRRGRTKSCGCWQTESRFIQSTTHGMSKSKIYGVWRAMIDRCTLQTCDQYSNYGGRGIKIFEEWISDFQPFLDYVAKLPHFGAKGYSLDRIDNNGDYEPGNLRWATPEVQSRNSRTVHLLSYSGKTMCLLDWSKETGIGRQALGWRIKKGWSVERALTTPVRKRCESAARHLGRGE